LIPFISKAEERWLIKRGLPPEVQALIESEVKQKEKIKMPFRRRKEDMA
jgi:hypothetical protein